MAAVQPGAGAPHPDPSESDKASLLQRTTTFKAPGQTLQVQGASVLTKLLGTKAAPNNRVSESLDYEPIQNIVFLDRQRAKKEGKKKLYGYTGHTLAKFIVTLATGVVTGLFAVALTYFVGLLSGAKLRMVQATLTGDALEEEVEYSAGRTIGAFFKFWIMGSVLVSIATAMVQYWAPSSAGAGVTLVMAYLNGNHIPNLLRVSTLVTKFVGTVCSVSAGLPMGPEGPMVHIGACVASVITYLDCKYVRDGRLESCFGRFKLRQDNIKERLKVLDEIVSDTDHREFVSAGVSAGISAAFNAPIGGVLFSMEEACSFWSRKTAWRCFIAATLSTFTIQMIAPRMAHGAIAPESPLGRMEMKDWGMQLPFLLINFGMAGLLGAAFNSLRMQLWKVRAAKTLHIQRILEVVGLVFLMGLSGFFFASVARSCVEMPEDWWENKEERKREYGVRFFCGPDQHNDLATLFLSSTHHTIVKLFSMGRIGDAEWEATHEAPEYHPYFTPGSLALYSSIYLVLMSIGAGLAIPGGLFMPSIVLGSAWGAMWGSLVRNWMPSTWKVQPGLYAMLAATGVLGGVFRSAISLVVLMVEGTQGIQFLPGVIMAVVVANWVAHHIHHDGVYESELERIGNVYMLRDEPPHRLAAMKTSAIMATGVVGFRSIESVARILQVLRSVTHNGFPVYVPEDDPESGDVAFSEPTSMRLEGLILRSQLLVLLQRRHFCDAHGKPVGRDHNAAYEHELENEMRTFFRRYYTHSRFLSSSVAPLDALQLDNTALPLEALYLDLRPFMNRAPITIRGDSSAARAHQVFISLGLRHLIVTDAHNHVIGLLTRKDLDHAAGHGWWRISHQAQPPQTQQLKGGIKSFLNKVMNKVASTDSMTAAAHAASSSGH